MVKSVKKLLKPYIGLPKEIYIIFLSRIVNAVGVFVFPLMTLILTRKIGLSTGEAGLWISINGLIFGPASLIGGKITDMIGRKKIIVIFDTLGALLFLSIALVEPTMTMVYLIMLTSFLMGVAQPAHDALMADLTTPDNRDGAYSLSYLGFNMGFALGPVIGTLLFENHLKLIFIGDGITTIIATLLILLFVKETIHLTKEDMSEERKLEQRVDGSIFSVIISRPILIYFALISFGYSFVYAQWAFMIPLHTEHNFANAGVILYGTIAGFNGLIVMVFTPIITSIFTKTKNIRRIVYGGILYIIGFGMLGFVSTKFAFFLSVFIFTIGEILITISSMPFIANHTPSSHRGRMSSTLPLIIGLGFTLGPIIMGRVLEYVTLTKGWRIVGFIMLLFTIWMFLLEKVDKHHHEKERDAKEQNDLAATAMIK